MFDKTTTTDIIVEDMMCEHCVKKITEILKATKGVKKVKIDLEKKNVNVAYIAEKVTESQLVSAIEENGYTVKKN